ncbi:AMP-binding protein [Verticiella sediminum]|uniref:Long-chain-fatty-acid--CoA ligase n=1 Tax=Verticiella sediminum TaxID=1247510 RepID=A0A556AIX4_9BURK|nr:AMP-binding protein [Verticiella sediminum]TSH92815.1 AMP-binding protein [Verticiella sediminum]
MKPVVDTGREAAHTASGHEGGATFHAWLARRLADSPDAVFLHEPQRAWTYREVAGEAERLAAVLAERGAARGDRMALWLPNGLAWLVGFLACARLGMIAVALNTRFRSQEVGDVVARSGARWLACWPDYRGIGFRDILREVPAGLLDGLRGVIAYGEPMPSDREIAGVPVTPFDQAPDAACAPATGRAADGAIVYTTSGTTAAPKLVLHDQDTLLRHGAAVAAALDVRAGDAVLLAAPLCGAFGFSTALAALGGGARLVTSASLDPAELAMLVARTGVTHTFANNELIARVLDAAEAAQHDLSSLRYVGFASFAPGMDAFFDRAERLGVPLAGLYGSSELQALVAAQPLDAPRETRARAGGRLVAPDARVRVRDPQTGALLALGEAGELEIRAPSAMRGYLGNAEATAQALDDEGWFRTGDLGHASDERTFVFLARRGDALRLNGFLVHPAEIEQQIAALPGVAAAQAVGVEYEGRTVVVAFVVAREGEAPPDEAAMIAQCARHLARYKTPRRIALLDAFPVVQSANSNKVQRHRLQEMARALLQQ